MENIDKMNKRTFYKELKINKKRIFISCVNKKKTPIFAFSVEFPAVLLDLSNGEIVDQFQQYVKPSQHKILSDFCKKLTGITQVKE